MARMCWCVCPIITTWQAPPADWLDGAGRLLPGKPGGHWLRVPAISMMIDAGRPANPLQKRNPDTGELETVTIGGQPVMVPKVLTHSSAATNGPPSPRGLIEPPTLVETDEDKWCLSLACGVDLSELEAAVARGEVTDVLEETYLHTQHAGYLEHTPETAGWSTAKIDRVKRRMGDDLQMPGELIETAIHPSVPLKDPLKEIGRRLSPTFHPKHSHTFVKE